MGPHGVAVTAKLTAAGRAVESRRADRLFEDPLAVALAGEEGFALMKEWRLPGMSEEQATMTIGPRTRFYDDLVVNAIGDGVRQVVLVAAGMDTRAFRLPLPTEVIVFELDVPELLEQKQAILDQKHAEPRCHREVVPVDLADDDWPRVLNGAGFDSSTRAVFIVEGLSWYLTEDENARLLDKLGFLAAPGSRLGFDLVSREFLEDPAAASFFEFTAARGIRWQFGTNDPAGFLAAHGWQPEVNAFAAIARRLGRWLLPGASEDVDDRAGGRRGSYFTSSQLPARGASAVGPASLGPRTFRHCEWGPRMRGYGGSPRSLTPPRRAAAARRGSAQHAAEAQAQARPHVADRADLGVDQAADHPSVCGPLF